MMTNGELTSEYRISLRNAINTTKNWRIIAVVFLVLQLGKVAADFGDHQYGHSVFNTGLAMVVAWAVVQMNVELSRNWGLLTVSGKGAHTNALRLAQADNNVAMINRLHAMDTLALTAKDHEIIDNYTITAMLNEVQLPRETTAGLQGVQGIQGVQGEQGIQGVQGFQGPPGEKGKV